MLSNTRIKIIVSAAILAIVILIFLFIRLAGSKNKPQSQLQPSPTPKSVSLLGTDPQSKLLRFKLNKYRLLPLMVSEATPQASPLTDGKFTQNIPTPLSYQQKKAKITYLPLPDIFQAGVEDAIDIEDYRNSKKAIISDLQSKNISICDLNIYWIRPRSVEIKDLTVEDIKTDGC